MSQKSIASLIRVYKVRHCEQLEVLLHGSKKVLYVIPVKRGI
ncbi:hypothetical protein [Rickettsia endosymbiont of Orchestes rusci]